MIRRITISPFCNHLTAGSAVYQHWFGDLCFAECGVCANYFWEKWQEEYIYEQYIFLPRLEYPHIWNMMEVLFD